MRVRVLFFGRLKEIVGRAEDEAELSDGSRVEDLFARYGNRYPEFARFRASVVASVNQEFAEWRAPLASGDEVAFLPPVILLLFYRTTRRSAAVALCGAVAIAVCVTANSKPKPSNAKTAWLNTESAMSANKVAAASPRPTTWRLSIR